MSVAYLETSSKLFCPVEDFIFLLPKKTIDFGKDQFIEWLNPLNCTAPMGIRIFIPSLLP